MTFSNKPINPTFTFGEFEGKTPREVPSWYLQRMFHLARDGRIMDKDLASHIIDVYKKRNEQ